MKIKKHLMKSKIILNYVLRNYKKVFLNKCKKLRILLLSTAIKF